MTPKQRAEEAQIALGRAIVARSESAAEEHLHSLLACAEIAARPSTGGIAINHGDKPFRERHPKIWKEARKQLLDLMVSPTATPAVIFRIIQRPLREHYNFELLASEEVGRRISAQRQPEAA